MNRRKFFVFLVVMLAAENITFAADPTPIKIKMMALWQAGTAPFKVFEQFAADVKGKIPRRKRRGFQNLNT